MNIAMVHMDSRMILHILMDLPSAVNKQWPEWTVTIILIIEWLAMYTISTAENKIIYSLHDENGFMWINNNYWIYENIILTSDKTWPHEIWNA